MRTRSFVFSTVFAMFSVQLPAQEVMAPTMPATEQDPASGIELVRDVWPGPVSGSSDLTAYDGQIFFAGEHPDTGIELWRSDGTTEGTALLVDTRPGPGSGFPQGLLVVADKLFFIASDGVHGLELWVSDGTAAGTRMVRDIAPGSASGLTTTSLLAHGGRVVFISNDGISGEQLWISDGTAAGSRPYSVTSSRRLTALPHSISYRGVVLFAAEEATHGAELWRTDGTEQGTVLLKDIVAGPADSFVSYINPNFIPYDGDVVFSVETPAGPELWRTDGSEAGTIRFWAPEAGMAGASIAGSIFSYGDILLFDVWTPGIGMALWRTDGTEAGTALVRDGFDGFTPLGAHAGIYYLHAGEAATGSELWRTDGTAAGTELVLDFTPGPDSSEFGPFSRYAGMTYLRAGGQADGAELYRFGLDIARMERVEDLLPGPAGAYPNDLTVADGTLFFVASGPETGGELYRLNTAYSGVAVHETPIAQSIQSGVGLIRGWACDAGVVAIAIDEGEPIQIGYGTQRGDTAGRCGAADNGYGMVIAWGLLGNGSHRLTTYVDGARIDERTFTVVSIGDGFVKGLQGEYVLDDFPAPGESVRVDWSEPDQNFIITGHDTGSGFGDVGKNFTDPSATGAVPGAAQKVGGARHESPAQHTIQSGVGLIRGWACEADRVAVSIDGGDLIPIAYGTDRDDTRAVCGDADNGFGMVIAWGLLGNGVHKMRTFIDGTAIAEVEFEVVAIGDGFVRGLQGMYTLEGFPASGQSVDVEWVEADQNFRVTRQGE